MNGVSRETERGDLPASPWLTVVGMGDNGVASLSPAAQDVLAKASVIVGGQRLLDLLPTLCTAQLIPWTTLDRTLTAILERRGQATVVLATGDPMWFGMGATLARALAEHGINAQRDMAVFPTAGAFSLAAAAMQWPLQDCLCLTAHGRPLEALRLHMAPGQKLLVLSHDGSTPAALAADLCQMGYGASLITALWHLGGQQHGQQTYPARDWPPGNDIPALNTLAVDCRLDAGVRPWPTTPGLPDEAFEHDGQITKCEARALTLMALAPWPGAHLWDIGAGSGSVSIEWMRAARGASALAVERDPVRLARISRNALALGVPSLKTLLADLPGGLLALDDDPRTPDAIFVGGGVSRPGLLEKLWARLPPGGRLVTNAVTLQAERTVLDFQAKHGGILRRLSVSRLKDIGPLTRWDSLAPLTQLCAEKS